MGIWRLSIILCLCTTGLGAPEAVSKHDQPKHNNYNNIIGSTVKPDLFQQISQNFGHKYQPQAIYHQQPHRTQHLQQALPYNHQSEFQQQTPVAMVIIAQPAYIPASMLQNGNVAQQLLQLFQGNQLKYEYVPANHQPVYQPITTAMQPTASQYVQYQPQQQQQQQQQHQQQQQEVSASTFRASPSFTGQAEPLIRHEALPTPQALVSSHVVPHHLSQDGGSRYQAPPSRLNFQQPLQDIEDPNADFSKLAQEAAQHFLANGGLNSGSRSAPAIITGLEHFSPEQQEKIKEQLGQHFGSPLKPLNLAGKEQETGNKKFFQERQRNRKEKFIPSLQVKNGEITQTTGTDM